MAKESHPGIGRRAPTPAAHTAGGVNAALHLVPLPALMLDDAGTVLACNERFGEEVGLASTMLVGREWWQAFSLRSAASTRDAWRAITEDSAPRGSALLAVLQADGARAQLSTSWQRLTEPGTSRLVWIVVIAEWRRGAELSAGPARLAGGTVTTAELAAIAADELGDELPAASPPSPAEPVLARVRATVAGLRRYARAAGGAVERVRAGTLIHGALATLEEARAGRAVHLVDASRAEVTRGVPDPERLVAHLLGNALRHAPHDAAVEVRTYDEPGFACIEIRDGGPGLPPDVLAAASEPVFARSGPARATGLSIARAIARVLGGSLRLANDPVGGAVAVIALPSADAPRAAAPSPSAGPLAGRHVLLVDDDPVLSRALLRVLQHAGAQCTTARTAAEALAQLDAAPLDVMVTDYQLPDGDGLALVRRALERSAGARVVVMSGNPDPSLAALARSMGAAAVLPKPFEPTELLAAIASLVTR